MQTSKKSINFSIQSGIYKNLIQKT